jgi:hypothetical protein
VADHQHVLELVQLLDDLVDELLVPLDADRDAGDGGVAGRADREAVDVEPASGEEAGDPGEHAGAVLDEDGQGLAHVPHSFRFVLSKVPRKCAPYNAAGAEVPNRTGNDQIPCRFLKATRNML